jgi:hypothetical protein
LLLIIDIINKTKVSFYFLIAGIVSFAADYSGSRIIHLEEEWSKEKAVPIINALDKYHEDKNEFPDSLKKLAPDYIASIPKTRMGLFGTEFEYSCGSLEEYSLGINIDGFHAYYYSRKYNKWFYND